MTDAEVRVTSLTKRYPGVTALDDVSIRFGAGQVVGLVGENGAGKSTLTKVLAGAIPHREFDGEVQVTGTTVAFASPRDALNAGIALIPQELSLHPMMTISENIMLGRWPRTRFGTVSWPSGRREAERILSVLGLGRSSELLVAALSPSEQQLVAIGRGLARQARLLLLDEPSAALDRPETARLLDLVRALARSGVGVVYISHRLDEVFAVCDSIVVLRNGAVAMDVATAATDQRSVVSAMLGRSPSTSQRLSSGASRPRPPILRASVTLDDPLRADRKRLDDVHVVLHPGEIVGLVGLVGSGRTELLWSLFGALPRTGSVTVDGKEVSPNPWDAIDAGIGLVSEERRSTGLFGLFSVSRNVAAASLRRLARVAGLIRNGDEDALANDAVDRLGIKVHDVRTPVAALSGGNQQKTVLGRWIVRGSRILLLDEPARGIDIGSRTEIYSLLRRLADEQHVAILSTSSDIGELVGVCDRFMVLHGGRLVAEVDGDGVTEHELLVLAGGSVVESGACR
jgi:ABC-type sugar transport system ATPase subunit